MKVLQIFMRNPLRNFNYILYSEVNHKAIFVDPLDIEKTLPLALEKGLEPAFLLNTHGHHDHIRGNKPFLEKTGAKHLKLKDGEEFFLSESESIQAIHTPGHTMDHYCFLLKEDGKAKSLVSGDTLFNAGVGNCKNGGDVEDLYRSITEKIAPLPDELELYPGHDYLLNNLLFAKSLIEDCEHDCEHSWELSNEQKEFESAVDEMIEMRKGQSLDDEFVITSLKTEKRINPFLKLDIFKSKFQDKDSKEIFYKLRSLRDQW